jgi:hypothetical protein
MKIPFEMMPNLETQKRIVAAYKEIQDVPFSTEESFMAMMVDGSEATPREIIITLSLATNPLALAAYAAWLQLEKPAPEFWEREKSPEAKAIDKVIEDAQEEKP